MVNIPYLKNSGYNSINEEKSSHVGHICRIPHHNIYKSANDPNVSSKSNTITFCGITVEVLRETLFLREDECI